jgi:hypothetical protein
MQLNPRENFTIVRQLEDHTDSSTHYVQAVIRNARTDTIITTINLTDQGNRRFSKAWQVPADVSGQGFWISILTTVYDDSAYTTKSPSYGEKMEEFLVQDRYNFSIGSGGGGTDLTPKRLREIMGDVLDAKLKDKKAQIVTVTKEVVVKIPTPMEMPKMPDMGPLTSMCRQMMSMMSSMDTGMKTRHVEGMASKDQHISALENHAMTMEQHTSSMADEMAERKALVVVMQDGMKQVMDALSKLDSKVGSTELKVPDMQLTLAKPTASPAEQKKASVQDARVTSLMQKS